MRITKKMIEGFLSWDRHIVLPNGAKIAVDATIAPGCYIGDDVVISRGVIVDCEAEIGKSMIIECDVKIGACAVIGSGVFIGNNAVIGEDSQIGSGSSILSNSVIGSNVVIEGDVYVMSRARIQNNVLIKAKAIIQKDAIIKKGTHIFVISMNLEANYAGEANGEHYFRLGYEVRPLSWYLNRREGEDKGGHRSGWAWIQDTRQITEDEYRFYLQFFKNEAKRLGIQEK